MHCHFLSATTFAFLLSAAQHLLATTEEASAIMLSPYLYAQSHGDININKLEHHDQSLGDNKARISGYHKEISMKPQATSQALSRFNTCINKSPLGQERRKVVFNALRISVIIPKGYDVLNSSAKGFELAKQEWVNQVKCTESIQDEGFNLTDADMKNATNWWWDSGGFSVEQEWNPEISIGRPDGSSLFVLGETVSIYSYRGGWGLLSRHPKTRRMIRISGDREEKEVIFSFFQSVRAE